MDGCEAAEDARLALVAALDTNVPDMSFAKAIEAVRSLRAEVLKHWDNPRLRDTLQRPDLDDEEWVEVDYVATLRWRGRVYKEGYGPGDPSFARRCELEREYLEEMNNPDESGDMAYFIDGMSSARRVKLTVQSITPTEGKAFDG